MATMANWNGHTFVVSPSLIRGFTDLKITGKCETTDKNSNSQKYVERKNGECAEISMTVSLNAQTGVTDVYAEAMEYVQEATDGATAYFYLGSEKLLPAKMMLTQTEITEIVHMPGQGAKWISCDVKLTFKQGSKTDGSTGSSGVGGTKKVTVNATAKTLTSSVIGLVSNAVQTVDLTKTAVNKGINLVKDIYSAGKSASENKGPKTLQDLKAEVNRKSSSTKATTTQTSSAKKTEQTTSRPTTTTVTKLTKIAEPLINLFKRN